MELIPIPILAFPFLISLLCVYFNVIDFFALVYIPELLSVSEDERTVRVCCVVLPSSLDTSGISNNAILTLTTSDGTGKILPITANFK